MVWSVPPRCYSSGSFEKSQVIVPSKFCKCEAFSRNFNRPPDVPSSDWTETPAVTNAGVFSSMAPTHGASPDLQLRHDANCGPLETTRSKRGYTP